MAVVLKTFVLGTPISILALLPAALIFVALLDSVV